MTPLPVGAPLRDARREDLSFRRTGSLGRQVRDKRAIGVARSRQISVSLWARVWQAAAMPDGALLPRDGLVIVAKRDCPTCVLVEPVMQSLDRAGPLTVFTQDDPTFPSGVRAVVDDSELERSFHLKIEAVPTLIRFEGGREVERAVGWDRTEWLRARGRCRRGQGPAGLAARLRLQERRARRAGSADRALRRDRPASRARSRSANGTIRSRPASSAAGATACRSCRRPTSASCACWAAPSASPTRSSAASRPTSRPAPSRRSRSTR